MKLYISNPSTKATSTLEEINKIISKLNNLYDSACTYNQCAEENQKLRSETLPIYEGQERYHANMLSKLEETKRQIEHDLKHLSPLQLAEKFKLTQKMDSVEREIGVYYNNYQRARASVSEIIKKISANEDYIDSTPLLPTIHAHQHMITKQLNPAIKKLSKLIQTPLTTYNPSSMFYIERFQFENEDKFELD